MYLLTADHYIDCDNCWQTSDWLSSCCCQNQLLRPISFDCRQVDFDNCWQKGDWAANINLWNVSFDCKPLDCDNCCKQEDWVAAIIPISTFCQNKPQRWATDLAKQNHAPTYQSKSYQQRLLAHPHLEMHTAEGQCHDIAMQLTGLIWTGFLSILLLSDDDVAKPVVGDKSFRL